MKARGVPFCMARRLQELEASRCTLVDPRSDCAQSHDRIRSLTLRRDRLKGKFGKSGDMLGRLRLPVFLIAQKNQSRRPATNARLLGVSPPRRKESAVPPVAPTQQTPTHGAFVSWARPSWRSPPGVGGAGVSDAGFIVNGDLASAYL